MNCQAAGVTVARRHAVNTEFSLLHRPSEWIVRPGPGQNAFRFGSDNPYGE
jgi:hypothetical protein